MDDFKDKTCVKRCAHCGNEFYRDKRNTWEYWSRAKFCSRECNALAWAARPRDVRQRFEKWFDKGDGCWEWKGSENKNRGGYGAFGVFGKMVGAHVFALELDGRPVGKGQYACHTCDNPRCVNPAHLYVGSPSDNVRDMISRNRHRAGELHYAARLTEQDVRSIRADQRSNAEIAKDYGVNRTNIIAIKKRKTWKNVA